MIDLFSFELSHTDLILFIIVGLLIGMAKVGINGLGMVAVPLLALVFGGRLSTGIMLPILIMADVFGTVYYHRHAQWDHLIRLLPSAVIGVVAGTYIGEYINDELFKGIMGVIIFGSVGILLWLEKAKTKSVPHGQWFAILIGILLGFTTMVGNLAGAVMSLYLLVINMPKNKFIGTAAWFFIIINLIKVPFHVLIWETIEWNTLFLDLTLLPAVALGAFLGIKIVERISDTNYRYFIIVMTILAALAMVID
jgi:uncharacterized membrane protein YfcA